MNESEPGASGRNEEEFSQIPAEASEVDGEDNEGMQVIDSEQAELSDSDFDGASDTAQSGGSAVSTARIGSEVLERLLELMGLDGDVLCARDGESMVLNIEGDDLGVLIGRRGMTLSALQYLVRLMIASRESEWPSVTVDVCGYKKRRHSAIESLARKLADQAKYRRRPITLEPMPPDERRVVHLALANHPDVYTESVGMEMERKVVIHPKGR